MSRRGNEESGFPRTPVTGMTKIGSNASLIERCYPLPPNRRIFIETEVADKIPSIGYAYLVRIAEAGLLRNYLTTNFDDLLTKRFINSHRSERSFCAHDSSVHSIKYHFPSHKIIKLHETTCSMNLKTLLLKRKTLKRTCGITGGISEGIRFDCRRLLRIDKSIYPP